MGKSIRETLKSLGPAFIVASVVLGPKYSFQFLCGSPLVFHDLVAGFSFPDDDFGNLTRNSDWITVKGHSVSVHHKGFISWKWVNFGYHRFAITLCFQFTNNLAIMTAFDLLLAGGEMSVLNASSNNLGGSGMLLMIVINLF